MTSNVRLIDRSKMVYLQALVRHGNLFILSLITLYLAAATSTTITQCFESGDIVNITCPFDVSQSVTMISVRWSVGHVNSLVAQQLFGDAKEQQVIDDNHILDGPSSLIINTTGMTDANYTCTVTLYYIGKQKESSSQQRSYVELRTCDSMSTQSTPWNANYTTTGDIQNSTEQYIAVMSYVIGAILVVMVFAIIAIVVYCRRKRIEVKNPSYTAITHSSSSTTEA